MVNLEVQEICTRIISDYNQATILNAEEINELIEAFISLTKSKPILDRIKLGSLLVVGDIHGDFAILKSIIKGFTQSKSIQHIVFLGDIVDRGSQSIACLNLLYALKITYPKRVHVLRGNHEAISVNSRYGFLTDILNFTGQIEANNLFDGKSLPELYVNFNRSFGTMPLALLHEDFRYFFVHGGIPVEPISLKDINNLPKADLLLSNPIIKQMLWNDPREEVEKYTYSMRGDGVYLYGHEIVDNFLEENNLKMIIRAHEVIPDGFQYLFNKKLLSIFTSEDFYQGVNAKVVKIVEKDKLEIFHPTVNSY